MKKGRPLYFKILAGLIAGALLGGACHWLWGDRPALLWAVNNLTDPAGKIFIRLILMMVVPLVVAALALGVAELGDVQKLGRVGFKTLTYAVLVSSISVLIGLFLVNWLRPGHGLSPEAKAQLVKSMGASTVSLPDSKFPSGMGILLSLIPDNPFRAASQGDMLAVMFFALVLGLGLAMSGEKGRPLSQFLEGLYHVCLKVIDSIMKLAPYGVACLLFTLTARLGYGVLQQLFGFVFVVLLGLALHQFVVYSFLVKFLGRMSPLKFFRDIREVMITAFSTSSSVVTLPTALEVSEQKLKIPREVGGFVLTLGSSLNQNGTALYEGVTVLFLAQFFGVELSLSSQLMVLVLAVLGGVGTAGIPSGSLPMIAAILNTVGVPPGGIAVILGVDRILDMCRTVLNVTGDLTAALYVAESEKKRESA